MIHFCTFYKSPFLTQVLLGMFAFFALPENQVQLTGDLEVVNQQVTNIETANAESLSEQKQMQSDTAFFPLSVITFIQDTVMAVQFDKKTAKSNRLSAYFLPPSLASPSKIL